MGQDSWNGSLETQSFQLRKTRQFVHICTECSDLGCKEFIDLVEQVFLDLESVLFFGSMVIDVNPIFLSVVIILLLLEFIVYA